MASSPAYEGGQSIEPHVDQVEATFQLALALSNKLAHRKFSKHLFNNVEARNAMLTRAASSSVTELELLWQKLLQDSWEVKLFSRCSCGAS